MPKATAASEQTQSHGPGKPNAPSLKRYQVSVFALFFLAADN
jgi:hypothetical protein